MKRTADDAEVVGTPTKRARQFLKEGFMAHGPQWANQVWAASEQIAAQQNGIASADAVLHVMETMPSIEGDAMADASDQMDVEPVREKEWWEWWNEKLSQR